MLFASISTIICLIDLYHSPSLIVDLDENLCHPSVFVARLATQVELMKKFELNLMIFWLVI